MNKFEYASPTTKEQAVALLGKQWGETEALAGGTDLLSLMKDFIVTPKRVVNLKNIAELRGVTITRNGGARIGALATIQETIERLGKGYGAITQAATGITSPQIRNMGTVGGDLCQRPRCWYYRAGFGVLAKDESGKALVPGGDNRYHAILGNDGEAKFVNPSSLAPAFIALAAKIKIFGPNGAREVDADKFFVAPKSANEREYMLAPNEIVTEINIPGTIGLRSATYEVRQKEALDWPLAAASVALTLDAGKKVKAARIALGHVAPTPWNATEAAQFLVGKTITEDVAAEAGKIAVANAKALSRNGYKIQLAQVAVKRAILQAVA
ncbi:MAG TPA: FAD binding domain-containing protein [Blastocatellia bacterium]|nr:FAD binding domain-containing protein [Blastocatellia bacterium]HMY70235.1 FAD binding domain-containing protein [Blastocatellia bacterium]HMZ22803.1 FAD binding domain-containing protein [Blastocatellia bacterium]HNG30482.1 FAD binding domain-containing protein [Blastocatellia bacterium]